MKCEVHAHISNNGYVGAGLSARKRLGVEDGDMLRIDTERGDCIYRRVHKIPSEMTGISKDDWLWVSTEDLRLLNLGHGDGVSVSKSDELVECPPWGTTTR
jgi:hypothetical protein